MGNCTCSNYQEPSSTPYHVKEPVLSLGVRQYKI